MLIESATTIGDLYKIAPMLTTVAANLIGVSGVDLVHEHAYTQVGDDPVGKAHDGMTAHQDAYAVREDGLGTGTSKMDEATDRVADRDGMTQHERNEYKKMVNEFGEHPEKFTKTTVGEIQLSGKQIIMADGTIGGIEAQKVLVLVPPTTEVYVGTYEYLGSDGHVHKETCYFIKECVNPAVDAAPDPLVPRISQPILIGDSCPLDGTLFDSLEKGIYEGDRLVQVIQHGTVVEVPLHVVIADSAEDARRIGLANNHEVFSYTQMFYRDADGCLHNVGCYEPGYADAQAQSPRQHASGPGETGVWDPEQDDADKDGVADQKEIRKVGTGEGRDGIVGAGLLEADLRRQGFTALTRVK